MPQIKSLNLNQTFVDNLPADPNESNQPRQVKEAFYSFVNPQKTEGPVLIHTSNEVMDILGITEADSDSFLKVVTGNEPIVGAKPYAMCYGGHQFGNWAGQLGDGRAINIAEIRTPISGNWVLQLKGAGQTPYSRGADGLAVLRSSIREYLMSEAMHHLGVNTTRALSLALTGDQVLRDILYNGNAAYEKGAIVCRVSPSFIRFGNFEIFAARRDYENLKKLANYCIEQFYPGVELNTKAGYLAFFKQVAEESRKMVLDWQRVGFVHGVMNTDNMSILGLTIDYGPYGWLENYDPDWTPNTTDEQHKRYRFGNQPSIVLWNLTQLANALYPLIEDISELESILKDFRTQYQKDYQTMMLEKLGLFIPHADDSNLINQLTDYLQMMQVDMTLFFRNLAQFDPDDPEKHTVLIQNDSYLSKDDFRENMFMWRVWLNEYAARIKSEKQENSERIQKMNRINPKYVLRNYMAHLAIEAADEGDYTVIEELFDLLKHPYAEQPYREKWFAKRPKWAEEKVGCSMLSCSS